MTLSIDTLKIDCVDAKPINCDWSELEYAEDYEYWVAAECLECERVIGIAGIEHKPNCAQKYEPSFELDWDCSPVMNYWYPVPDLTEDDVFKIADLPLCIVQVADGFQTGLALTGGGMDLSWEICEARIRLGYYPPAHFANLPTMADKYANEHNQKIIDACERSLEIAIGWLEFRKSHLAHVRRSLVEEKAA